VLDKSSKHVYLVATTKYKEVGHGELRGWLLVANCYTKETQLLQDSNYIKHFMRNLVLGVGLTPVKDTLVVATFPIPEAKNQVGVSATIILVESHAGIHTWPELEYARIELSSCARVKKEDFESIIKAFFIPYKLEVEAFEWD